MSLKISQQLYDQLRDHGEETYPHECCGILLGKSSDDGISVQQIIRAGNTRTDTLPSGFVRYEHDLADSPTTLYAGLGHSERFPDYWELFSPTPGRWVR